MGKIVDKVMLQAIQVKGFKIVHKDDEYPHEDDTHEDGKNQDDHPGLGCKDLLCI